MYKQSPNKTAKGKPKIIVKMFEESKRSLDTFFDGLPKQPSQTFHQKNLSLFASKKNRCDLCIEYENKNVDMIGRHDNILTINITAEPNEPRIRKSVIRRVHFILHGFARSKGRPL